ncbi:MAG TPA: hypothetical protein P5277_04720 [Candidatus Paceibacterota bacterium]|nr:hypothetical protein [Candidatus Paceibacterota bacterium]
MSKVKCYFIILFFVFCSTNVYAIVNSSNYSFNMHTLGSAAGIPQGILYSARTLTTAFQSGESNTSGLNYSANIGFLGNSTGRVLAFSINSYTASPVFINQGETVNLFISASSASSLWASITRPDLSVQNVTLTNNADTSYSNTTLIGRYNVSFYAQNSSGSIINSSTYFTVIETAATIIPSTNQTISGGGGSYECIKNSDCKDGKSCFNHKCVKLFDIKIISIESPIKPSTFFNFIYYIKGMADINNDVIVEFWLEKDNKRYTAGQDTIYMGSFEEKTEKAQLFLPDEALEGVYSFYVKVYYGNYSALSYRVIQVNKKGAVQFIESSSEEKGFEFPSGIFLFILGIVIAVIIGVIVILIILIHKFYKRRIIYGY